MGAARENGRPSLTPSPPFFCKCLPDWSTTPPANSHTVDWDLDLMRYISRPSSSLSANHSSSCPFHKPMRGLLAFIWSKSSSQSAGSSLSFKLVFPVSTQKHSWVLPIAGMLCVIFCIYLDNAKLNLTCRIANMGYWFHCDKSTAANQDASGYFSFLSPLPGQEGLVCLFFLSCGLILFHYMQFTGEALVKHTEDNGIHITSADVDCNNINIHSG